MKKISLQWKLTLLTTVLITILCGCLTFFLYKNGVYYFDTLQESITDQGTEPESVYIDIPDNEWDDFVAQFSMKIYNSKSDYRSRSFLITVIVALFGGALYSALCSRALLFFVLCVKLPVTPEALPLGELARERLRG